MYLRFWFFLVMEHGNGQSPGMGTSSNHSLSCLFLVFESPSHAAGPRACSFFASWNPNLCWLIAQFCWLNHVKSLLPVKSPLLPGEKLEGVQDALKGFQAANGVLWFHQEAGPGVSAELMVRGERMHFSWAKRLVNGWLMSGCFMYLNACNVRIYTLPNNEHFIRSWSGYLRLALSWDAAWQPVIWCRIMLWGLLQTTFWELKIGILHVNTKACKVDWIYSLLLMSLAGIKRSGFDSSCPFGRKMRRESHGNGPVVSRQGSGITGRQQVQKYHAKNHGRRDGHALRPEAGGENQPGSCMWRKLLGDCWGKCKQIQAVNRTVLFTVDYKNRCTICIFASIYLFVDDSGQQIPATT